MKMFKGFMLFLVVLFFSCATTSNDVIYDGVNRYIERSGGYSICPPESWQVTELAGFKYKILIGPEDNDLHPNINFVDEKFDGELKEGIDLTIPELQRIFANFKLIERNDFITEKNVAGERILYTFTQNEIMLRMAQYFFLNKNGIIMTVSCSSPGSVGDKYDDLYNRTVKTFEWTR